MRTNIEIDDALMAQAQKASGQTRSKLSKKRFD
jgi:Arc/MetJ family transcription regulator